jgi:hypothetical protein
MDGLFKTYNFFRDYLGFIHGLDFKLKAAEILELGTCSMPGLKVT